MMSSGNHVYGGRNSSSWVSNLSASAPPFTVDRLNSSPKLEPPFCFSDSYFDVENSGRGWHYQYPSAPISSGMATSFSSPHEYQFLAPASRASSAGFEYGTEVKPSYSPCVPSFYGDHNIKHGVEEPSSSYVEDRRSEPRMTSLLHYPPSSFDLECGFQPVDSFGFHDGNCSRRLDPDLVLSAAEENRGGSKTYRNHRNEVATGKQLTEDSWGDSAFSYNEYLIRKSTIPYQKCDRYFDEEACLSSGAGGNMDEKKTLIELNQSRIPYFQDSSSIYPRSGTSEMEGRYGDCSAQDVNGCDLYHPFGTGRSSVSLNQSGLVASELNYLQAMDILGSDVRSRVNSQSPAFDFFGIPAISCNSAEPADAFGKSADIIDHQNLGVDSPCWRGTPSSHFSLLDDDSGGYNLIKKPLDECNVSELEKYQSAGYLATEPRVVIFGKTMEPFATNKKDYAGDDDISCPNENDGKPEVNITSVPSGGAKSGDIPNMLTSLMMNDDDPDKTIPVSRNASSDQDVSGSGIRGDVPAGVKIASNAAEEEDFPQHFERKYSESSPSTMIEALHSISEQLLVRLSNDSGSLEDGKIEVLERIISNLKSCLSKNTTATGDDDDEPESDTSESSRDLKASGSHDNTTLKEEEPADVELKPGIRHNCDAGVTTTDAVAAQNIKKVLEENLELSEETNSQQALLFKNLWLEAEAKLCSISYKANFYKMKMQMEEMKLKPPTAENESRAVVIRNAAAAVASAGAAADDDDAKRPVSECGSRDDDKKQHPDCVVARLNVLKLREVAEGGRGGGGGCWDWEHVGEDDEF